MNIDQQIQQLIEQAPAYGLKVEEVQQISPVFEAFARRLPQPQYFILQNLDQNWIVTTLQHRTQEGLSKNVVYAYPSLESVKANVATADPQVLALPIPTVQILFQLLAMEPVESVIFLAANASANAKGSSSSGTQNSTEFSRQALRQTIAQFLRLQHRPQPPSDIG